VSLKRLGFSPRFALTLEDRTLDVLAQDSKDGFSVVIGGIAYAVGTVKPRRGRTKQDEDNGGRFDNGKWILLSPIAGSVVEIRVALGDKVEQGAILMLVEAMKMQNELRAGAAGTVAAIRVAKGQRVETGTPLIEIEPSPPAPPFDRLPGRERVGE